VFSVKFISGEIPAPGDPAEGSPLAPGSYRTAINIHNPNPSGSVTFTVKAAIADGATSITATSITITGDNATEIDCTDIALLFPSPPPGFTKGFVAISVPKVKGIGRLQVIGVYTLKTVDTPPDLGLPT